MIRANAVAVEKQFVATCRIEGCGWTGSPCGYYVHARAERQAHLDWHRQQEGGS